MASMVLLMMRSVAHIAESATTIHTKGSSPTECQKRVHPGPKGFSGPDGAVEYVRTLLKNDMFSF